MHHRGNKIEKRRAVFLDRDGVINKEKNFVLSPDDIELYPFSARAIKKINLSGFLAIVITNQSAVARNYITLEELHQIHNELERQLKLGGAYLDEIYFCPHKATVDHEVLNKNYLFECDCRKPKPGMLFQAARDYDIDLHRSYFVGDSERDIVAGKNAGCIAIGVRTGHGLQNIEELPDFVFDDLNEAVEHILVSQDQ